MLEFDEAKHIYSDNGAVLPSVTQILSILYDFSGISPATLEYARQRGTAVHKACEIFDNGGSFTAPLDEVIQPYFVAWVKFVVEKKVRITATERRLRHQHMRYAGTFDAIGMIGDEEWLIDRKCTSALSDVTGVQLAAYAAILGRPLRRAAVQLKPDGTYVFQEYSGRSDWPTFVAAYTIFNWKENHK